MAELEMAATVTTPAAAAKKAQSTRKRQTALRSNVDPTVAKPPEITEAVERVYDKVFEFVHQHYHMQDREEVLAFLARNRHLALLLFEARPVINQHFGNSVNVLLRVMQSPEQREFRYLVGYIQTSLPVDGALARLQQFEEEWVAARIDSLGDALHFNLQFV